MVERPAALYGVTQRRRVLQVAYCFFDRDPGQSDEIARFPNERSHGLALLDEEAGDMASDEPRCACDENHVSPDAVDLVVLWVPLLALVFLSVPGGPAVSIVLAFLRPLRGSAVWVRYPGFGFAPPWLRSGAASRFHPKNSASVPSTG